MLRDKPRRSDTAMWVAVILAGLMTAFGLGWAAGCLS